ncbi:lytic murein transglycosylase [Microbacterium betulae]|uniref:Lytic murein transglycosylase n=1 Tax=Microbacterium betulae TaxID=2981139 RepID=A0AA97FIB3_9MICO|nr:lytic murein transglycosylase [Microbacterium sp. AB]WOF22820.1 lytic murein transglycosylase [Microbacterium sp. AB]
MRGPRVVAVAASGLVVLGVVVALVALASQPAQDPAPAPTAAAPAEAPLPADAGLRPSADPGWVERVAAETDIPQRALAAYARADIVARAEYGCAVGWNTLAGIGWVESHHGALQGGAVEQDGVARPSIVGIPLDGTDDTMEIVDTDGGALDGDAEWDRAVGPMQFIPETWSIWGVDGDGDGAVDPHDIDDAALTAARYLCHAQGTLEGSDAWIGAVRTYNDTDDYQLRVAEAATRYAAAG